MFLGKAPFGADPLMVKLILSASMTLYLYLKGGNYLIISPQLNLVVEVMNSFPRPWFIAGGWALDLAYGEQTREHKDVDLCCFREDLNGLLDFFADWKRQVAIPKENRLVPCEKIEDALPPRHELHFEKEGKKIEVLLIDRDGPFVLFRRDPSIRLSLDEFTRTDMIGRPFVSPSWQLLFKAKKPRPKDNEDFFKHAPTLGKDEKSWLLSALRIHQPTSTTSLWIIKLEKMLSQGS